MSEMLERVAKSICKSRTCEGIACCEWPAQMGRRHNCPVTRGAYDDAARAAIEAMREPTQKMRLAGIAEWSRPDPTPEHESTLVFNAVWRAMVDEILR